jgi:hypothetical protein
MVVNAGQIMAAARQSEARRLSDCMTMTMTMGARWDGRDGRGASMLRRRAVPVKRAVIRCFPGGK